MIFGPFPGPELFRPGLFPSGIGLAAMASLGLSELGAVRCEELGTALGALLMGGRLEEER